MRSPTLLQMFWNTAVDPVEVDARERWVHDARIRDARSVPVDDVDDRRAASRRASKSRMRWYAASA